MILGARWLTWVSISVITVKLTVNVSLGPTVLYPLILVVLEVDVLGH